MALILVSLGVVCRLLPHPFNFAPIAAVALFAGVYLGLIYAITLPVIAMVISDIFIGFYSLPMMLAVYGTYVIIGLIGLAVKKYKSVETVLAGSILASVLFFLVTNFAVWQFSSWYAHTSAGLINCFIAALPFFRNTLIGNLFYTTVLFGAYELIIVWVKKKKLQVSLAK